MRRALYIGRFQVFHLGHLDVLKLIDAAPDVDATAIVIGSAQYDHRAKAPRLPWSLNPFTADERRAMVEASIAGVLKKPWSIHAVNDTGVHATWLAAIFAAVPDVSVLYSSTPRERALFEAQGKATRDFPRARDFHAGTIRERLARGEPWQDQVPEGARGVLERIDAGARLRELQARDASEARR